MSKDCREETERVREKEGRLGGRQRERVGGREE